MNHQKNPTAPVASSSRLPPIHTQPHAFDDQTAAAAAALLQIKRSPSSAHPPLLPSIHDLYHGLPLDIDADRSHSPYIDRSSNSPYIDRSSNSPYLPPIRTDFQPYAHSRSPAYFPLSAQQQQQQHLPPAFHHYTYSPNASIPPPLPPASLAHKRKRSSIPEGGAPYPHPSPRIHSPKGKNRAHEQENELRIDVEGDADADVDIEVDHTGNGEGEGEVRCICGYHFDDGFTIQCERCHVWQHVACFSIPRDALPEIYLCDQCDPAPTRDPRRGEVDCEKAKKLQSELLVVSSTESRAEGQRRGRGAPRKRGSRAERGPGSPRAERKRGAAGGGGTARRRASSAAQLPHLYVDARKPGRRKESEHPELAPQPLNYYNAPQDIPNPNPSHSQTAADDAPWTEQYVPITTDIVHPAVRPKLRAFAHAWRGVTAFSPSDPTESELSPMTSCNPMPPSHDPPVATTTTTTTASPTPTTFLAPLPASLTHPSRPPTYALHALRPIAKRSYVAPYTCAITPSGEYLREPTNQYAQLGVPKQGVHLIPPPLELCLDARGVGGDARWVRSGCHPNAVLRPVVCGKHKASGDAERVQSERGEGREQEGARQRQGSEDEHGDGEPEVTFGVFAIRDLKAEEEIVLGWEWDDRHVVHELPRLLKEGYESGNPSLKRAMGEVLSTLFSTFTTCACGASAHDCAIAQMEKAANVQQDWDPEFTRVSHLTSHERQPHTVPDLGPLIGATRGMRTTERGQGGRDGVELAPAPSVDSVARAFRGADATSKHVHFPARELVVSPSGPPSPRKSWKRRYSGSRSADSNDEGGQGGDGVEAVSELPRKKPRTMPKIDSNLLVMEDGDVDVELVEETLPPKMRKNWIKETLRVMNTEDGDDVRGETDGMDVDGVNVDARHPMLSLGAMANDEGLKSPSTALAGLSLQTSTIAQRVRSPSSALLSGSPASHGTSLSPPTPSLTISPPEVSLPPPTPQRVKSKSPKTPSRSPTHSPARSHTSEQSSINPRPSPVSPSKPSLPVAPPVTPLLPSSAVNANPLPAPSPPTPPINVAPATNPPSKIPVSAVHTPPDSSSSPSHTILPEPAEDPPPPTPAPPKPLVKRSLADWKTRKAKERAAQALLNPPPSAAQPPPPASSPPQDTAFSGASLERGGGPSISTKELLVLPDVRMDSVVMNDHPTMTTEAPSPVPDVSMERAEEPPPHPPPPHHDLVSKIEALEHQLPKVNDKEDSPRYVPSSSSRVQEASSGPKSPPTVFSRPFGPPSLDPMSQPAWSSLPPSSSKFPTLLKSEDGETSSPPVEAVPPRPQSISSSRPSSRPPSRPRSPPTHPRSFHAVSPTPSLTRSSPPSRPRGGPPPPPRHGPDPRHNPLNRPVPSGPRALRTGFHAAPPSGSSYSYGNRGQSWSASSSRGSFQPHSSYERESDRGWPTRGRGRGGGGNGGHPGRGGRR